MLFLKQNGLCLFVRGRPGWMMTPRYSIFNKGNKLNNVFLGKNGADITSKWRDLGKQLQRHLK